MMLGLIILVGSIILVSSVNWVMLYLALELQTFVILILVAGRLSSENRTLYTVYSNPHHTMNSTLATIDHPHTSTDHMNMGNAILIYKDSGNDNMYHTEAGLKYLVLSAVSSGLFLFGCVLLYGGSGDMNISSIHATSVGNMGMVFIAVSLLFKLSVVPFHMWAPDVYEGAPTTTTALLATVPKIAVFFVLTQVVNSPMVWVCGILSIVVGAVGAINQTKFKRMLAYSGMGHIGFMVFGVGMGAFNSIQASVAYLIVYIIMNVCVFSVLLSGGFSRYYIVESVGMSRMNGPLAVILGMAFLSTAGIPPLAGFLGKW